MRRSAVIVAGAVLFGILAAFALQRYRSAAAEVNLDELKRQFVTEAGIQQAHNDVAQQVGLRTWKVEAKPWFLREVTLRAAIDADTPFPSQAEIIEWTRKHPDEVKELLKQTGARFEEIRSEGGIR